MNWTWLTGLEGVELLFKGYGDPSIPELWLEVDLMLADDNLGMVCSPWRCCTG